MGTLIDDLNKVSKVGPRLAARMSELVAKRNYLMHHFFQRNSQKFLSEAGRRSILDELRQIAQAFQDGDHILADIYEPLWAKCGIGEELIQQEFERMNTEPL
jgi:hypothetical protein